MKFRLSKKELRIFEVKLKDHGFYLSNDYSFYKLGLIGRAIYKKSGGRCIGFMDTLCDFGETHSSHYTVYIEKPII